MHVVMKRYATAMTHYVTTTTNYMGAMADYMTAMRHNSFCILSCITRHKGGIG